MPMASLMNQSEREKRSEDETRQSENVGRPDAEDGMCTSKEKGRTVKAGRVEKKKNKQIETKTVIFVPQTENSLLAKMLREEETHN